MRPPQLMSDGGDGTLLVLFGLIVLEAAVIAFLAFRLRRPNRNGPQSAAATVERPGAGVFARGESTEGVVRSQTGIASRGDTSDRLRTQGGSFFGREEGLHGDAFYGTESGYDKDSYIGRVSRGAELELLDTAVHKNEFDIDIIQVRVLSNEWETEVGRVGWVGLDDTSFRSRYNPESRRVE